MKRIVIGFIALSVGLASGASASSVLKNIQEKNGSELEIVFDTAVAKSQLELEFFRDIVQLSIKNSVVYPSKMISFSGQPFSKGFAYQYTPQWVRLRLTASSGKAESLKKQVVMHVSGKTVRLRWIKSDSLSSSAAAPATHMDSKQKALLDKILTSETSAEKPAEKTAAPAERPAESIQAHGGAVAAQGSAPATHRMDMRRKSDPNPWLGFAWLGMVAVGLLVLAVVVKKAMGRRDAYGKSTRATRAGILNWFVKKQWVKDPKFIEVLGNHYLGPKKNISVVRIKGRTLVLGVTDENINLIAQLQAQHDGSPDGTYDEEAMLEDVMNSELGVSAEGPAPAPKPKPVARPSSTHFRNHIKEKLKGLKEL